MLLAILLPFLSFIVRGKVFTGIICLILQITLIGWLPAAIWAVLSLNNERADKRNDRLIKAMRKIKNKTAQTHYKHLF
ncbi:YqaE/Pmp3 family membrane protein [Chryseobacterium cucumeris]|uniref:YqaE/Pmp3 family membrane protein n=1 Tax=Chryseobacterium cucumeris TaxID=1813611 RepID=UPI00192D4C0C|nr:YqaE/Pmp3 family membrane protein [Chryseobacterium cucumeris]QRA43284.1 YqaE/Pmp3 family membrane protein [Chryseobacterium cucumeris]